VVSPSLASRPWLERCTWRAADLVLPVSQVLAEIVRQAGVPSDRIAVIPNGIDEECFRSFLTAPAQSEKLGLQGKTCSVLSGSFADWHGLDGVLDLLADQRCPADLHLLVVGGRSGLCRGFKSRAEGLGPSPRVTLLGSSDRDGLARHIAAFDIALQPKAGRLCLAAQDLRIYGCRQGDCGTGPSQYKRDPGRRPKCTGSSLRAMMLLSAKRSSVSRGRRHCANVLGRVRDVPSASGAIPGPATPGRIGALYRSLREVGARQRDRGLTSWLTDDRDRGACLLQSVALPVVRTPRHIIRVHRFLPRTTALPMVGIRN